MKKLVGIILTSLALGGTAVGTGALIDAELDYENGKAVYEVETEKDGYEYEYEIDAATGAVLEAETEEKPTAKTEPVADDIGKEKAKEIALKDAEISTDEVTWEEVERDYDDGRLEYHVEFRVGNKEYDYEIDAKTGKILERDFDLDDDDRYDDDRYDDDYDDRYDDWDDRWDD